MSNLFKYMSPECDLFDFNFYSVKLEGLSFEFILQNLRLTGTKFARGN